MGNDGLDKVDIDGQIIWRNIFTGNYWDNFHRIPRAIPRAIPVSMPHQARSQPRRSGGDSNDQSQLPSNPTWTGGVMTRRQAITRYGEIVNGEWPNEGTWMETVQIPRDIVNDEDYNWLNADGGNAKMTSLYANRDISNMIIAALRTLKNNKQLCDLHTYDGLFVIRNTRGSTLVSAHSYGIAIDVNAEDGRLGATPSMAQSVVDAFTGAGFTWGGSWGRPDGMHFSLGF